MDKADALYYSSSLHDVKDSGKITPVEEALSQVESAALEGIIWRKLDIWILPFCVSFLLLSSLVCL